MGKSKNAFNGAHKPPQKRLKAAIRTGDVARVEMLLEAGVDPNVCDSNGRTPLVQAARFGAPLAIINSLLAHGADVDLTGTDGETPFIAAVRGCHGDIAFTLLAAGADPEKRDATGQTALDLARANGMGALADLLAERRHAALTEECQDLLRAAAAQQTFRLRTPSQKKELSYGPA